MKTIVTSYAVMRLSGTICVRFLTRSEMTRMIRKPLWLFGREIRMSIGTYSCRPLGREGCARICLRDKAHPVLCTLGAFVHRAHDVCCHLQQIVHFSYTVVQTGLRMVPASGLSWERRRTRARNVSGKTLEHCILRMSVCGTGRHLLLRRAIRASMWRQRLFDRKWPSSAPREFQRVLPGTVVHGRRDARRQCHHRRTRG